LYQNDFLLVDKEKIKKENFQKIKKSLLLFRRKREGCCMNRWLFFVWALCSIFCLQAGSLPRYWLIEEDFTKLGKKELYEEEKKKNLEYQKNNFHKKRGSFEVVGIEDLENPQYVFFMPLKEVSWMDAYPPIEQKEEGILSSTMNFQIFSLHEFLPDCSFREGDFFSESFSYFSYVLYDVVCGSENSFEEHLARISLKQTKKSPNSWVVWKVLLGADVPKYLVGALFSSKEALKETKLEEVFEEGSVKEIIRNRKSGWMKKRPDFCILKKTR
jgi:hypothetical protein